MFITPVWCAGTPGQGFLGVAVAFYTSLFLGCLVAALVIVWILRSLADVGRGTYGAILPSSHGKTRKTRSQSKARSQRAARKAARQAARSLDGANASTPWGWPGNGGGRGPSLSRSAEARSVKPAINRGQSALTYNTRRRAGDFDKTAESVSKPWGW